MFRRLYSHTSKANRKDYYSLLNTHPNADKKTIKENYYKLSKQYHPDLHPNNSEAHELFLKVNEAYDVLGNEASRREYDANNTLSSSSGPNSSWYSKSPNSPKGPSASWYGRARASSATGSASARHQAHAPHTTHFNYERHYELHYEAEERRRKQRLQQAAQRRGERPLKHSPGETLTTRLWKLGLLLAGIAFVKTVCLLQDVVMSWIAEKLSFFLGLDTRTLESQVIPYLMSFESATALTQHLTDLLGTSSESLDFIQQLCVHRFPPPKIAPALAASPALAAQKTPTRPESHFPSLPHAESSNPWPTHINIVTKKQETLAPKKKKTNPAVEKKKNNKKEDMTVEDALKELDIKAGDGKRTACQCQATRHALLTIAPNCLQCGKIICTLEGPGSCTFCGTPVLSREQQLMLIHQAKQKRQAAKQQQQQQSKARKTVARSVGYATMVSGDYSTPDEAQQKAEAHKEKLLEFQRSSAKRSTVIDEATDFILPTDQSNPWESPQERALRVKQQQANLRALQRADLPRRRVMTLNVQTKQVTLETVSSSEEEEAVIIEEDRKGKSSASVHESSTTQDRIYARPLGKLTGPTFVLQTSTPLVTRPVRKIRVQLEEDFVMK
ncbi:hypothetical protein BDF14DRAFT_1994030 [Spinellus fusiger]|nr:hypothetical protein BDF14DRAFT_1994030 [Spinellus fusiger]